MRPRIGRKSLSVHPRSELTASVPLRSLSLASPQCCLGSARSVIDRRGKRHVARAGDENTKVDVAFALICVVTLDSMAEMH